MRSETLRKLGMFKEVVETMIICPLQETASYTYQPAYHFTTTYHLPWIIDTGELRPSKNAIGGYPEDFLWATTSSAGDRTSTAMSLHARALWRENRIQLVRLTLNSADFLSFDDAVKDRPDWTTRQRKRLIKSGLRSGEDPKRWLCRSQPLPLTAVIRTEAKSYGGGAWTEINLSTDQLFRPSLDPLVRAFVIGDHAYIARREILPDNNEAYCDFVSAKVRRA